METARRFYGPGFEVRTSQALSGSNADWAELPEHERSFTLAHLQYLNLVAQRGTQRLLGEVRDLLEEIAAGMEGGDDEPDPNDGGPDGQAAALVEDDEDAPARGANEPPAEAAPASATPPTPAPAPPVEVLPGEVDDGELILPDDEGGAS
jgi:hypothetical protein